MGENWDSYADEWDNNEDAISFSDKAYSSLCEIINPEGLLILDFGCGTGLLSERMSILANRLVAVDSSDKMISVLNNKQLTKVDTLNATLSEETDNLHKILNVHFDLVVASSVCAFLPNYVETVRLLKRRLKSGGLFVQWDWLKTNDEMNYGLTVDGVESAFQQSGFEIISVKKAFSLESKKGEMHVLMGIAKNTI